MQSDTDAYYGRLDKARDFTRRATHAAISADSKETAALWQVNAALREAEFGNAVEARRGVAAAITRFPGRDVKVFSALALARTGNIARALALTEELEKSYPTDTVLKFYWLPTIHAAIELNRKDPLRALQYLEAATAYEMGLVLPGTQLAPVYLLMYAGALTCFCTMGPPPSRSSRS
jgi:eukaryotic-like serine/threonine-protein kinase